MGKQSKRKSWIMWREAFHLLLRIGAYFWDIGVDIIVGRQQIEKTFPEYKFKGKFEYLPYDRRVQNFQMSLVHHIFSHLALVALATF